VRLQPLGHLSCIHGRLLLRQSEQAFFLNLSQWAGWNYGWWRKIAMLRMGLLMADEIVYFLRFADLYFRFARDNLNGAGLRKRSHVWYFRVRYLAA
jgi:hypothetical protein